MKITLFSFFFVFLLFFCGCSTIILKKHQTVKFTSEPEGVTVRIDNVEGITPCELKVRRNNVKKIAFFSKDGYFPREMNIEGRPNFFFLAGLFCFGFPGILDILLGSVAEFNSHYQIKLAEFPKK